MLTAAEKMKTYRRRKKLRGLEAINVYLEPEDKKRFNELAEKVGGQTEALKKLLDHADKTQQAA